MYQQTLYSISSDHPVQVYRLRHLGNALALQGCDLSATHVTQEGGPYGS
jgi:hypothetical protein